MPNQNTILANRVVALGVAQRIDVTPPHKGTAWIMSDGEVAWISTEAFVSDWRVAGALMEECRKRGIHLRFDSTRVFVGPNASAFCRISDSLPRAIIEACVEALEQ